MKEKILGASKLFICFVILCFIHLNIGEPMMVYAAEQEELVNGVVYQADGTLAYYTNGEVNKFIYGLVYVEQLDKWIYFKQGIMDTQTYEFVYYDGSNFLVANGEVANITGLVLYKNSWYYLANGRLIDDYEGLTLYDGEWFYVRNGKLATYMSGICEYDGEYFLVAEGRLLANYTGMYYDGQYRYSRYGWCWIVEGRWQREYSGFVQYDGSCFFLVEGELWEQGDGSVCYKDKIYILRDARVTEGLEDLPSAEIMGYQVGECVKVSNGKILTYQGEDAWTSEEGYTYYSYINYDAPNMQIGEYKLGQLRFFIIA